MCIRDRRSSYQDTYIIKIKYFIHVTTKNVSGKLPFPLTELHKNQQALNSLQHMYVCKHLFDYV